MSSERQSDQLGIRRQRQDAHFTDWTKCAADKHSCRVIHMLEKDDPELEKLGKILLQVEYDSWKHPLDQMLEQLQRISFAVAGGDMDESSANQIAGWYFCKVVTHRTLRQYCEKHGFKPLVDFAEELVRKELEGRRASNSRDSRPDRN
jgi:hypothetical protein